MTPTQFRTALASLELSQLGAGKLLGYDGRTVRRWIAGDRAIPPAVTILIGLLMASKVSVADLRDLNTIPPMVNGDHPTQWRETD